MDTNTHDSNSLDKPSYHHAWRYFELHANQRISLFRNFVVLLSLYVTGAGFLLVKFHYKHAPQSNIEESGLVILSIIFILVTIIFWFLDKRNKDLIHFAENSLIEHEKYCTMDDTHKIFLKEKNSSQCAIRHTLCFRALYIISIISALAIAMWSICHGCIEYYIYFS